MKRTKRLHDDEFARENWALFHKYINFLLALTILAFFYVGLVNTVLSAGIPIFILIVILAGSAVAVMLIADLFA